jgi:hypothetical protein
MAPPQGPVRRHVRPRAKTPAERADEAAAVQRRLKEEAAQRRQAAAKQQAADGHRDGLPPRLHLPRGGVGWVQERLRSPPGSFPQLCLRVAASSDRVTRDEMSIPDEHRSSASRRD